MGVSLSGEYRDRNDDCVEIDIVYSLHPRSSNAVVIPVIDEGQRLASLLSKMQDSGLTANYDVYVCDGGSRDGSTREIALRRFEVHGLLKVLNGDGVSRQLQEAYSFCLSRGYSSVVTIDGNDKDDPQAIPQMFSLVEAGYDYVQASRFLKGGNHRNTPLIRLLAIRLLHAPILSLTSGVKWTDSTQGYRAYSARLLSSTELGILQRDFPRYSMLFYVTFRAARLGFKVTEIPTERMYPRGKTPTRINFLGSLKILRDLIWVVTHHQGSFPARVRGD